MAELLVEGILGLFILYLSYEIGWKGNIRLIHSYHYTHVSQEDIEPFTRKMGIGGALTGGGLLVMPLLDLTLGHEIGYWAGLAGISAGMALMLWTTIRYNGSLFGLRKKK